MKYKKSIIILVMAIFIFGAASVCASDTNDMVIANLDDSAVGLSDCEKNNEISSTDKIQTTAEANKGEIMGNDNGGIVVSDSDELQETVLIVENDTAYQIPKVLEGEAYYHISLISNGSAVAGRTIYVDFDGDISNVTTNISGEAIYKIPYVYESGKYPIKVDFAGDEVYNPSTAAAQVELLEVVTEIKPLINITEYSRIAVKEELCYFPFEFIAAVGEDETELLGDKLLNVTLDDKYTVECITDEYGIGAYLIPNNTLAGQHFINITFEGGDGYTGSSFATEIEIHDLETHITAFGNMSYSHPAVIEGNASYPILLTTYNTTTPVPLGNKTVKVRFGNDDVEEFTTDDFGYVNFTLPANTPAGNHTIVILYAGEDGYTGTKFDTIIEVYDVPTIISAQGNVSYPRPLVAEGHAYYCITLTTDTYVTINGTESRPVPLGNKTVTVDFIGIMDSFTTDDFGLINITIAADVAPGNYTGTLSFVPDEDEGFIGSDLPITIEVYDVPTRISAQGNVSYPRPLVAEGHACYSITLMTDTYVTINGTECKPVPLGNKTVKVRFAKGDVEEFVTDVFGCINYTLPVNVGEGNYSIQVIFDYDGYKSSEFTANITVYKMPTSIELAEDDYAVYVDDAYGNLAVLQDKDGNNVTDGYSLIYTSDNESVVKIVNDSFVAVGEGNATITVSFNGTDMYESAEDKSFKVGVFKIPANIVLANDSIDIAALNVTSVGASLNPSEAGNLNYVSNDTNIAAVSPTGIIKANNVGTALITVSFAGNDKYAAAENKTMTVNVELADASVSVNNTALDLFVDDNFTIVAATTPADLNVTYVPDNSGVVSVDENGVVTALKEGTSNITVKVGGDGVYAENSTTVTVTVKKIPTEIIVQNDTVDMKVGEEFDSVVGLMPSGAGELDFTSNDVSVVTVDGIGAITAVGDGVANVTVRFIGNDKYAAESKNITVTVSLNDASVSVNNSTLILSVDDTFTIAAVTVPDGLNVTYVPDDSGVVSVDEKGIVTALKEGTAFITVKVGGDGVYAENSTTVSVTVKKIPTEIIVQNATVDMKVGEEFDPVVGLIPSNAGRLSFRSSDDGVVLVNGYGYILAVGEGNATVTVAFDGNKKYAAASKNIAVTVSLNDASVSVNNSTLDLFAGDAFTIVANTTPAGLNVTYVPDNSGVVTVENGVITAVKEGTATVTLKVGGDGVYALNTTAITVTVNKLNTTVDVSIPENITVGDNSTVNVVLPEDATGNVTAIVDGEVADTVAVTDGSAEVTIPSMSAGNHTVEIAYSGDGKYNPASETKEIAVSKKDATPEITIPSDIEVGDNATVDVRLPGDAGGNVTLKVDGEAVDTVPVTDGTASVKLPNLNVGNHTVEIDYSGDGKYNTASKTVAITVGKDSTNITVADVTATYKVNKYLVVKLTDSKGNPLANSTVTVELGAAKNYTSDENGQIKVKISNMVPKTYTAKITFKGDDKYAGSETTAEVTVKKATAKITAKAKTFKTTTKTKKYTVVLKANGKALKNKWVYLKVNGKTYKAKTNSKGKATFKITQLNKAGKFKATVTFKGNDYYKKATKKATIKVKSVWKTV